MNDNGTIKEEFDEVIVASKTKQKSNKSEFKFNRGESKLKKNINQIDIEKRKV